MNHITPLCQQQQKKNIEKYQAIVEFSCSTIDKIPVLHVERFMLSFFSINNKVFNEYNLFLHAAIDFFFLFIIEKRVFTVHDVN